MIVNDWQIETDHNDHELAASAGADAAGRAVYPATEAV